MTNVIRCHPEMEDASFGPSDRDQEWFAQHRSAVVRFRPAEVDELAALEAEAAITGMELHSFVREDSGEGGWVAVVDLLRACGEDPWPYESVRVRIECPPVSPGETALATAVVMEWLSWAMPTVPFTWRKPSRKARRKAAGKGFGS